MVFVLLLGNDECSCSEARRWQFHSVVFDCSFKKQRGRCRFPSPFFFFLPFFHEQGGSTNKEDKQSTQQRQLLLHHHSWTKRSETEIIVVEHWRTKKVPSEQFFFYPSRHPILFPRWMIFVCYLFPAPCSCRTNTKKKREMRASNTSSLPRRESWINPKQNSSSGPLQRSRVIPNKKDEKLAGWLADRLLFQKSRGEYWSEHKAITYAR